MKFFNLNRNTFNRNTLNRNTLNLKSGKKTAPIALALTGLIALAGFSNANAKPHSHVNEIGYGDRQMQMSGKFDRQHKANVIEIASFNLKPMVSFEEFAPLDEAVEVEHVSQQPGFVSRETATGENGEWIVVVHWESLADADASMNSFATAPAAADFMSKIDLNTMKMTRYEINK